MQGKFQRLLGVAKKAGGITLTEFGSIDLSQERAMNARGGETRTLREPQQEQLWLATTFR